MVTREDVYARLAEAADLLQQMEPHSPVPYLIRRAIEWGNLPFPQLMKALIREDYYQAITEMNRELGIKDPPPE
jgi:type VI secretion system protein ImpA